MAQKRKMPMRQCVGCQEMKNKKEMMRVLKSGDEISIDLTGKRNGRGAYLCFSRECFQKARKNKGLERSLKVSIPEEIYNKMEGELSGLEK